MNIDFNAYLHAFHLQSQKRIRVNISSHWLTVGKKRTLPLLSDNLDRQVLRYQGNDTVNDTVKALELTGNISRVLDAIKVHPEYTYDEYASMLNLGRATVARAIKQLQSNGYIQRLGSDKTGKWSFSK